VLDGLLHHRAWDPFGTCEQAFNTACSTSPTTHRIDLTRESTSTITPSVLTFKHATAVTTF
jgi:hypothetical protein